MSPTRRMRVGVLLGVLALLTIIYITTGAKQTRDSPFYTRTVSRIEHKAWEEAQIAKAIKLTEPMPEILPHQQGPIAPLPSDGLKERLKQAEQDAKKSADAKWKDIESELSSTTADQAAEVDAKSTSRTAQAEHEEVEKDGQDGTSATAELEQILDKAPVVIFSKTYCRFSRKAKHILLDAFTITPTPYVVELDTHERGPELQDALRDKTGRRTVPNILIKGQSIGGGDDIEALWKSGSLKQKISTLGGSSVIHIEQNHSFTDDQQP